MEYNIYCDESCHLENDHQKIMAFGAVWCPTTERQRIVAGIHALKEKHHANGELKWTKVSPSRNDFFLELVRFFFSEPHLHFRGLVVLDKSRLDHSQFNEGSHDTFYYKMYFSLLNKILSPDSQYNLYFDIKDTRSRIKLRKLKEVLCFDKYDFTSQMVNHIQNIHSHESDILQLTDFLLGSLSHFHRRVPGNTTKNTIVDEIKRLARNPALISTPLCENKFNLFLFMPRKTS
jgi:hypothetical protein